MDNSALPTIAVTMGDPAGIGPEVVARAMVRPDVNAICRPIVFGDRLWMQQTFAWLGTDVELSGTSVGDRPIGRVVHITQATTEDLSSVQRGHVSGVAGRAGVDFVKSAAGNVLRGEVDALVTAPLNKEAMALGGCHYPGHTELLASITGTDRYGMLLVNGSLRVVHVSTHVSLLEAIGLVRRDRVLECIKLAHVACLELGIDEPRIAVAGLNPHAGENGLFGREEIEEIIPAISEARRINLNVTGPYPPDSIFIRARNGEFDLVIAMYHDQGHIPVKLNGIDGGVNITIGLPIIRVSVDHGTAFDIANLACAREDSLVQAIEVAVNLVHASNRVCRH